MNKLVQRFEPDFSLFSDWFLVSGKVKFFDSRKAGQSSLYGFGLGYSFGQ